MKPRAAAAAAKKKMKKGVSKPSIAKGAATKGSAAKPPAAKKKGAKAPASKAESPKGAGAKKAGAASVTTPAKSRAVDATPDREARMAARSVVRRKPPRPCSIFARAKDSGFLYIAQQSYAALPPQTVAASDKPSEAPARSAPAPRAKPVSKKKAVQMRDGANPEPEAPAAHEAPQARDSLASVHKLPENAVVASDEGAGDIT